MPFRTESHAGGEAAIGQTDGCKLFYQCFHHSCKSRSWLDARQIISGDDSLAGFYPSARSFKTATGKNVRLPCNESVDLACAADIQPEPVCWIWNGYIAQGKVHILAGPSGHGKTTLLLGLAAIITIGGRWPDGSWSEVGDIAIWSGEDDPADTLVPRLMACGADLNRVQFINGVHTDDEKRSFDPSKDMPLLRKAIAGKNIKMLIIDPIVSAVGGDSHKNAETRRGLQPVVDLAAEMNLAVYGVTHFTKGTGGREPVERITGSLAFGALTRLATVAMKLPDDGNHPAGARLFVRAKSNIGPDGDGFYYYIEVVEVPGYAGMVNTRVLWGEQLKGSAKELIAKAEIEEGKRDKLNAAMRWLTDVLSNGPVAADEVIEAGELMGHSQSTLYRARKQLGIESKKLGYVGGWGWFLPGETIKESIHDPKQTLLKSSGVKQAQVIDSVEDFTKISKAKDKEVERTSADEDSKAVKSSNEAFMGKGLGGVKNTKISSPRVLRSADNVDTFDGDEFIL